MDERQLASFVAVYRSGSLVNASVQLNISQSALSRRLAEIQSQLGVTLFQPRGRGIENTPDADRLFPLALKALEACSTFRDAALDPDVNEQTVPIKIAATPHTIEGVIAWHVAAYQKERANVDISFVEAGGAEIEDLVLRGDASVGISARPNVETGLSERTITRLSFIAMANEPFSESEMVKGIDIKAIGKRDLILLDRRFQARLVIDAAFELFGVSPKIVHEGGSTGVIKSLATAGMGTAVLLSNSTSELHTTRIRARGAPLSLDLTAIWDPTARWHEEIESFVESLKENWSRLSDGAQIT